MYAEQIKTAILQAFPDADVEVASEDNVHFQARVVADAFANHSRVQRHRMVHSAIQAAVGEALGREIHALTLNLKTPEEVN